jgi:hypothetical protein
MASMEWQFYMGEGKEKGKIDNIYIQTRRVTGNWNSRAGGSTPGGGAVNFQSKRHLPSADLGLGIADARYLAHAYRLWRRVV